MPQKDDQPSGALLSAFSIIRKTYTKPAAHDVVNITLAQFLSKTQDEKTALYLIGLAVHTRQLGKIFANNGADWVLINLRSGEVIMYGAESHQPGEKEIETLLFAICEVCFLYERSLSVMLHDPRHAVFDA